jgi:hypothetical protein
LVIEVGLVCGAEGEVGKVRKKFIQSDQKNQKVAQNYYEKIVNWKNWKGCVMSQEKIVPGFEPGSRAAS